MEEQPQRGSSALKAGDCEKGTPTEEGAYQTVRDLMRTRPKTLPREGDGRRPVAAVRQPLVLGVLLVDGDAFVEVVDRDAVDDRPDDAPAQALARSTGVTSSPEAIFAEAIERLEKDGTWRLVGSDGVTLGRLLCLNSNRSGFCQ